ncbi:energy transducer TonB [Pontibacter pudoricolor]|uniref:energy transducer TonB n=1 Tax=Pontibacter pudoricolor TaxID=2694930 RepID=UPI001391E094|nr:energy transducer TonB [Pontibacter pudoricolor]
MLKSTPIENISLSFICDKDLDQMQPCDNGRYCAACNKTVIDFTTKGVEDLHEALEKEGKICGSFLQSQVARPSKQKLFGMKRIAASLFLALGFSAYSKELQAQSVNHPNPDKPQQGQVFGIIQGTHPVYKHGGDYTMLDFIKKNLRYPPDENVNGLVVTSFIIDTSGTVTEPKIIKGLSEKTDKEALRVVKLLEFYPSIQDGKKVPVRFTLPVRFNNGLRKKNSP